VACTPALPAAKREGAHALYHSGRSVDAPGGEDEALSYDGDAESSIGNGEPGAKEPALSIRRCARCEVGRLERVADGAHCTAQLWLAAWPNSLSMVDKARLPRLSVGIVWKTLPPYAHIHAQLPWKHLGNTPNVLLLAAAAPTGRGGSHSGKTR